MRNGDPREMTPGEDLNAVLAQAAGTEHDPLSSVSPFHSEAL